MKQTLVLGAVLVALTLLSGCASSGSSRYSAERKFVVDQVYMDAVDRASRQSGVRVTWVNPPTKRAPIEDDTSN